MSLTLMQLFEEAKVNPIPDFFRHIPVVDPDKKTPMEHRKHQITGINLCFCQNRTGLYDEQGTGKSLIAQAVTLWHAAYGNKTVAVMPPVLQGQFEFNLLNTFPGVEGWLKVEKYRGTPMQRMKMRDRWDTTRWPDVVIMSYAMFLKEWSVFTAYCHLVMDEARDLATGETKLFHAAESFMATEEKAALVMNGTPAPTDLRQLYGYIQFVSPGRYRNKLDFESRHVEYKNFKVKVNKKMLGGGSREIEINVAKVENFRNKDLLYQNFFSGARRVEKADVLTLKSRNVIPFSLELAPEHMAAYTRFIKEKLLIFPDNSVIDGTNASALRTLAMRAVNDPSILGLNTSSATLEAVEEIMEQIDISRTKLILAAHHQSTVELFAKHFHKFKPAVIYGPTANRSEDEKNKFLRDPGCRVVVMNFRSGGVGLNLQSVSNTMVSVEPTGSPGELDQTIDRVHRSGQSDEVNAYLLSPIGTVFKPLIRKMFERKVQTSEVISRKDLERELFGQA